MFTVIVTTPDSDLLGASKYSFLSSDDAANCFQSNKEVASDGWKLELRSPSGDLLEGYCK